MNPPVSRSLLAMLSQPNSEAPGVESNYPRSSSRSIESEFVTTWGKRFITDSEKSHKAADQDVPG